MILVYMAFILGGTLLGLEFFTKEAKFHKTKKSFKVVSRQYRGDPRDIVRVYNETLERLMKEDYLCERSFFVSSYELKKDYFDYKYFIGCLWEDFRKIPQGFEVKDIKEASFLVMKTKTRDASEAHRIYLRAYEHMPYEKGFLIEEYVVKKGGKPSLSLEDRKTNYYFSSRP